MGYGGNQYGTSYAVLSATYVHDSLPIWHGRLLLAEATLVVKLVVVSESGGKDGGESLDYIIFVPEAPGSFMYYEMWIRYRPYL